MSLLDMDERLLDLAARVDLVYSPLVDAKEFPADVDVTLVEGAVSTEDDERRIVEVRARTRILVSLGDCAVTSNVPGMRNAIGAAPLLSRSYVDNVSINPHVPSVVVPPLLPASRPVHRVVAVDLFLPGCPPSADLIDTVLDELIAGRLPDTSGLTHFGA
jgi:NAD-reducing hydrogenase small subunit